MSHHVIAALPSGLQNSLNGIIGFFGALLPYVVLLAVILFAIIWLAKKVPLLVVALGIVLLAVVAGWAQSPDTFKSDMNMMVTP